MHYQPIVDLRDRRDVGLEALVRWDHPTRGPVPPAEFIPLAEETGLIVRSAGWVLREACRAGRRLAAAPTARAADVSVNISARQLARPGVRRPTCADACRAPASTRPARCLEITESTLVSDLDGALDACSTQLRDLGVRLAIDDFGTGYSSLSLPADASRSTA